MTDYDQAAADHVNRLGDRLRTGFDEVFRQHGVRAHASGTGSLSNVLFTDSPVRNARTSIDAMLAAGHIPALLHLGMLRNGIMSASRLMYCTSTAMTDAEVNAAIAAMDASIGELLPYIRTERPNLLL